MLGLLGLVQNVIADTTDFWHVYYNDVKIRELNEESVYEGVDEIVIKTDTIKDTDSIIVRYGKDTDCIPCIGHLTVEDAKYHREVTRGQGTDDISPISLPLNALVNFKKLNGENSFRVLHSATWPGHESDKHFIFRIRLVDKFSSIPLNLLGKKPPENLWLGVSAKRSSKSNNTIEVEAILFNDNPDTIYFLSTSCKGVQSLLQYDTTKFTLILFRKCNSSYLCVDTIKPYGQLEFKTHFKNLTNEFKIKLGFDLYQVDKSFDLKKHSKPATDLKKVYKEDSEKSIIWANEKDIEWK